MPEVARVSGVRIQTATLTVPGIREDVTLVGAADSAAGGWTIVSGADLPAAPAPSSCAVLVGRPLASALRVGPGSSVQLTMQRPGVHSVLPPATCRVAGIAQFAFGAASDETVATTLDAFRAASAEDVPGDADLIVVASRPEAGPARAVDAIRRLRAGVHVYSNEQVVEQFNRNGFAYFRQISLVLSALTMVFAFMLVATLLTVSVNQRLGEIAALRAIGIRRGTAGRRRRRPGAAARRAARSGPRPHSPADARPAGTAALLRLRAARARHPRRGVRRHRGRGRGLSDLAGDTADHRGHAATRGCGMTIVDARDVSRIFPMPAGPIAALRGVSFAIEAGEHVAITGPSGCGKSTLLHLIGGVDTPTSGRILFEGRDVSGLSEAERGRLRLTRIGFVFQRFFLLPMLTAAENVELPQAEAGVAAAARRNRTRELLAYVGLAERADHLPSQLSGGEMQRVAIARALANRPALVLADEPTGELDDRTSDHIADLFDRVNADGTALLVVTHNPALAGRATRRLAMASGRIVQ